MIYFKLTLKNILKLTKEYMIYFITIIFTTSIFYAVNAFTNNQNLLEAIPNLELMTMQLEKITFVINFIIIFLIVYVNKFIIKQRLKEFGIYILLGMNKYKIAMMFCIENILIGVAASLIGCLLGVFQQIAIERVVMDTLKVEYLLNIRFNVNTCIKVILTYSFIFVVVGVFNARTISKLNIRELVSAHKKNERIKINHKFNRVLFLAALLVYIFSFQRIYHYFKNYNSINEGTIMILQLIVLVLFISSVYMFFYCFSAHLMFIKRYFYKFVDKELNIFLINEIGNKIYSNAKLMATLTLTIMISFSAFSLGFIFDKWGKENETFTSVYDIEVETQYNDIKDEQLDLKVDYQKVVAYIASQQGISSSKNIDLYFIKSEDFYKRKKEMFPALVMKLSDYNALRAINGYEKVDLEENQFALHYQRQSWRLEELEQLEIVSQGISINNQRFYMGNQPIYDEIMGNSIMNDYVGYSIIIDDAKVENLKVAKSILVVNLKQQLSIEESTVLKEYIAKWYAKDSPVQFESNDFQGPAPIGVKNKIDKEVNASMTYAIVKLTGIFIGGLLMVMTCTILSIQMLLESLERKQKHSILEKIGADQKMIRKNLFMYISFCFNLPFFVGIISFLLFLLCLYNGFKTQIGALFTLGEFITLGLGLPIGIFISIYLFYFLFTCIFFVKKQN